MRLRRRVVGYCDEGPDFAPTAAGSQFVGNIVVMMWAYARSRLGEQTIPFEHCDRVIAIGQEVMAEASRSPMENGACAPMPPRAIQF
jgi:hypothetical protein